MFDDHSNKAPIQIAKNIDLNLKRFKQKRMSSTDFGRGRTVNKYKSKQTACFILIHGIRITHNSPPLPLLVLYNPNPNPGLFFKRYIYSIIVIQYSIVVQYIVIVKQKASLSSTIYITFCNFHYIARPSTRGHEAYNLGRPFLDHHYYILVYAQQQIKRGSFKKEIKHFLYI